MGEETQAKRSGEEERGRRRKRSRFSQSKEELQPAVIPQGLTGEQQEVILVNVRLEEIRKKLVLGDFGQSNPDRSPSPPPEYDRSGVRTNTRDIRIRARLEGERDRLIRETALKNKLFIPPTDWRPQAKRIQYKMMLPQEENPDINFIGLIIGPRGHSLKRMEAECGAKVSIRGKGAIKEGKKNQNDNTASEPLHCIITGETQEQIDLTVARILRLTKAKAEDIEMHKREQLRELATLNGTLRDADMNDGPSGTNILAPKLPSRELDAEYANFMSDIEGSGAKSSSTISAAPWSSGTSNPSAPEPPVVTDRHSAAPWLRGTGTNLAVAPREEPQAPAPITSSTVAPWLKQGSAAAAPPPTLPAQFAAPPAGGAYPYPYYPQAGAYPPQYAAPGQPPLPPSQPADMTAHYAQAAQPPQPPPPSYY
eukprot:TRINITY_DN41180_c0_g1_i1.p1 TRINITY_DN41180_c0_g1~~TRINITY_DN41180_c0_g1_i1.p1  ORF type:complete len:424 (+),score=135.66 TRINITY_DN41180_c0_g1_i1:86-1357(+)